MKKLARKKSSDPAQEELRSHKDIWNSETSKLIGQLISLKKGMNGRGDKTTNLPPSSIKDPLPSEVNSYLGEVINSFNKVIDHAHSIIQEQSAYSQNRKKSLTAEEEYLLRLSDEITNVGLEKISSWWGSRLKAKLKFFKLNPELRKLRWKVLVSSVDTDKQLLDFESSLLSEDLNDLGSSFTRLNSFLVSFRGTLLSDVVNLVNYYQQLESQKKIIDQEASHIDGENPKVNPETTEPTKSETKVEQDTVSEEKDKLQRFHEIFSDLENLSFVILHIASTKLDAEKKKKITDLNDQFRKNINEIHAALSKDTNPTQLLEQIDDLINKYDMLLGVASNFYGLKSSFAEIAASIPPEELNKQANTISRWLNKLKLSVLPDSFALLKLEIANQCQKLRKDLDSLMNLVEDSNFNISNVIKKIEIMTGYIEIIINKMIALYKKYILDLKIKSKDNKVPLLRVVQRDEIADLEKEFGLIKNIVLELSKTTTNA